MARRIYTSYLFIGPFQGSQQVSKVRKCVSETAAENYAKKLANEWGSQVTYGEAKVYSGSLRSEVEAEFMGWTSSVQPGR
jgi:hypothetical protein